MPLVIFQMDEGYELTTYKHTQNSISFSENSKHLLQSLSSIFLNIMMWTVDCIQPYCYAQLLVQVQNQIPKIEKNLFEKFDLASNVHVITFTLG